MQDNDLVVEGSKEVPIIILNRLEKDNKLSINFMWNISKKINDFIADGARAIIVTNNGEYFCGGGELGDYSQKSSLEIDEFGQAFINLHKTICFSRVPIIAAIRGKIIGGGFSLVEAFDFAFASKEAIFSLPEIKSGIAPMMALVGVKKVLSKKKCYELALLGREISADTAEKIGLINKSCNKEEVLNSSIDIAEELKTRNPIALDFCKRLFNATEKIAYEEQLNQGLLYLIALLKSVKSESNK